MTTTGKIGWIQAGFFWMAVAVCAWAGSGPDGKNEKAPAGEIAYLCREKGVLILKTVPRGGGDERTLKEGVLPNACLTPAKTILTWDDKRAVEIDASGKTLWEFPWDRLDGISVKKILSLESLADGHLLLSINAGAGEVVVALADRQGTILRQMASPGSLRSVQALDEKGEEGVIALAPPRQIVEMDWNGKTLRTIPLPKEYNGCTDMARLPDGHYIVAAHTPALPPLAGEAKSGRVAELDAEGKKIWEGSHGCPRSIQPLPDGTVLIGAG